MHFQSLLLLVVTSINLAFMGLIFARNARAQQNLIFGATILFNVIWSFGDAMMISAHSESAVLIWSRLFFIAPMLTAYFLLLFSISFPDDKPIMPWLSLGLVIPVLAIGLPIALVDDALIKTVIFTPGVNELELYTTRFLLYSSFFTVYFGASYALLYAKSRKYKGVRKSQLYYILIAALVSSISAVITNISLPAIGVSQHIWLGPVFTVAYVALVTYAIARHRLFDVRLIVVRSIAYIFAIGAAGLLFVGMSLLVSSLVFDLDDIDTNTQAAFLFISILVGISFVPLKVFFDKLTARIFYRDAYRSDEVLKDISSVAVTEFEVKGLINKSMGILRETLNPVWGEVILLDEKGNIYDTHAMDPKHKLRGGKLVANLISQKQTVLIASDYKRTIAEEDYDKDTDRLAHALNAQDIGVSVRLSAADKSVGYLLLGQKRSGNVYTKQDEELLATVANETAIAIQNAIQFAQIEKFNETLQEEIEAATRKLQRSNEKLKALDVAKDEFISMASHQLRTPLTSVKGYISMVLEGDVGKINAQQAKLLDQAYISSQRMVYLIADLLNVSRLRTGKFVIDKHKMYLPDVVEGEISQLYGTAEARGLKIKYDKPKEFPMLMLDETKIRQVIMNFTDNAIYYTPKGGTITVEVKASRTSVSLSVTDSGIGVPKKEVPHLFTKFYRAGNARKARPDGTGLGLYMAKKVVVAQGGAMIFKTKEGKGSTFGFSFPRSKCEIKEDK